MGTPFGYRSEILFKRLLLLSILTYFILSVAIELSPPLISVQRDTKKPPRIVKLIEAPSKGREILLEIDNKKEEERRLAEERERRLEEERKRMEEKRLAEERKLNEERTIKEKERRAAEEKKRKEEMQRKAEERKRQAEERRLTEEKRRAEEAKRLAREKNREVAMNTGLLKALKGEKKSLDKIVTEEMNSVLAETSLKKARKQPGVSSKEKHPPLQKKVLKESEGIGDVPVTITEAPASGLSGKKGEAGIAIRHIEGGETMADGGAGIKNVRSQQSIREVVASRRGGIDFVYKKALRNNPTLKGVIVIEFTISENGEVMETRIVSSTIKDPSFEEQVLRRIRSWKFPPLPDSGNTIVTYPIEFFPV